MYNFGDCSKEIAKRRVSLKEKRKVCYIVNSHLLKLLKIDVDGCLNLEGPRCDYLIIKPSENHGLYIEIKGRDIAHAFKQLKNSIKEKIIENECKISK